MKKNNQKIIAILSLFLAGLIIFYFCNLEKKQTSQNYHLASPNDLDFFETVFSFDKKKLDLSEKSVVAGVIPHHLLAGDLIAEFFAKLENKDYDTIVLIGPNHFDAGDAPLISSSYDWQTPYGVLECDIDGLEKLDNIKIVEQVFENEHAINSEVGFIKKTFPNAKFIPIVLKANVEKEQAIKLAGSLAKLDKKILLIASVDFSHYKDNQTAQTNDQQSIRVIKGFDYESIYNLDIDSPPSIYTLLKYAQNKQTNFLLLNNSNSALLSQKLDLESTTSYVTGYFIK